MYIDTYEQAKTFAAHPVKPYDPLYTRDRDTFNQYYTDFVYFLRGAILSNFDNRSIINHLNNLFYDSINKIMVYERHTGTQLLASPRSYFSELYSCEPLSLPATSV